MDIVFEIRRVRLEVTTRTLFAFPFIGHDERRITYVYLIFFPDPDHNYLHWSYLNPAKTFSAPFYGNIL